MPASARPSILRKMLEEQLSVLAGELATVHEQELASREAEQRDLLRAEISETLNQAVRLLRQAEDFSQMAAVLADSSSNFCKLLAVFSVDKDRVKAERARGLSIEGAETFALLDFPASDAAAIAGAIQTGDPVVTMTTPREVSAPVMQAFTHAMDERAYILPLTVRDKAVGLVYASGAVEMASVELLAQAAALALEARLRPPKPDVVTIAAAPAPAPVPERKVPEAWTELAPADQELHLRAQRFSRVHVAGMRLFMPEQVKQGRENKDLYATLQKDIDAGREMFRQTFLAATLTMVDYFHLELLRTLANEDASLLGEDYPGPLV